MAVEFAEGLVKCEVRKSRVLSEDDEDDDIVRVERVEVYREVNAYLPRLLCYLQLAAEEAGLSPQRSLEEAVKFD